MRDWLRLARVPFAPTAALDALVCGWFALQAAGVAPHTALGLEHTLLLIAASIAFYLSGMAGNDYADRARDAEIAPTRPIPAGRISPTAALVFASLCGVIGLVVAGVTFGWIAPAATALFILAYDGGAKKQLVPGVVTMGMVRMANASIVALPLVMAGRAPIWALLPPLMIGLYSAAITLLSTTEDVEAPGRRWKARLMSAVAFGGAGGLAWLGSGNPWPTLGVIIAFGVVSSTLFGRTPRPGPAKRMVLEMLLGLYFLEYVIATAAWDGHAVVGVAGLGAALAFIYLSRQMIRALFVVKAPTPA